MKVKILKSKVNIELTHREYHNMISRLNQLDSVLSTYNEMNDLSILMGLDPTLDKIMLKAKIIQSANNSPDKFLSLLNDMDKEHRVFLKKALEKGVLSKPNGVWKHGTLNVGLTDDQAIVWLKDNADVYALLKHQLRTGKIEKVEEKVEEVPVVSETVESSSISSSTIKELEQDIENK